MNSFMLVAKTVILVWKESMELYCQIYFSRIIVLSIPKQVKEIALKALKILLW